MVCAIIGLLVVTRGLFSMGEPGNRNATNPLSVEWPVVPVPGRLVFQSDRDGALSEIWLLEQGTLRKLASGTKTPQDVPKELPRIFQSALADLQDPKWSPDGSKILCVGDEELVILLSNGSVEKRIRLSGVPHNAAWAPDGSAIYYTKIDKIPQRGGTYNIYRFGLQDRSERQVTNLDPMPGIRGIIAFAVSPDDRQVVFCMVGEKEYGISLWRIGTDGSGLEVLVKYGKSPAWSPDGTKIAYVSNYLPSGEKISKFEEILVYDVQTGTISRVTNNEWEDAQPVFSPDGTKIAFKSARHKIISHGAEIFVINLDGTGEARLTPPKPNPQYPNDPIRGWATDEHPDWAS